MTFQNIFGNSMGFAGTSDFGGDIAQKQAVSVAHQQMQPGNTTVIGAAQSAKSPHVGTEGKAINTAKGIDPAAQIHVGWNTDGASDDVVKAIIFDSKGNAEAAEVGFADIPEAGTLYSQFNNVTGQKRYDVLVSRLCNRTYHFNTLRIRVSPSATATGTPRLDNLTLKLCRVDENFDIKDSKTIHVGNQESPYQQRDNLVDITLTDALQRIDDDTVLVAVGEKDAVYSFTWMVTARQ